MQKIQALVFLAFLFSSGAASAEVIVVPVQRVKPAQPAQPAPAQNDGPQKAAQSMMEMLKNYQQTRPLGNLNPEEVERDDLALKIAKVIQRITIPEAKVIES